MKYLKECQMVLVNVALKNISNITCLKISFNSILKAIITKDVILFERCSIIVPVVRDERASVAATQHTAHTDTNTSLRRQRLGRL